jgi:hypothetical protein
VQVSLPGWAALRLAPLHKASTTRIAATTMIAQSAFGAFAVKPRAYGAPLSGIGA